MGGARLIMGSASRRRPLKRATKPRYSKRNNKTRNGKTRVPPQPREEIKENKAPEQSEKSQPVDAEVDADADQAIQNLGDHQQPPVVFDEAFDQARVQEPASKENADRGESEVLRTCYLQ